MKRERLVRSVGLCLVLAVLAGCGPSASGPRLRLENRGSTDIQNLSVLFPDGEILFGDVGAGATTPYRPVPHGVYAYAA